MTLEQTVDDILYSLILNQEAFTAFDITKKVKETFLFATHREIRDIIRSLRCNWYDYVKTNIDVTLADGTIKTAVLYHHINDSQSLDTKYDASKRTQVNPTIIVSKQATNVVADKLQVNPPQMNPRELWHSLFAKKSFLSRV